MKIAKTRPTYLAERSREHFGLPIFILIKRVKLYSI